MRFLVSMTILLLLILPTMVASATTLTEVLPGIGSKDIFGVFGGHVTISGTGLLDVELKFNYPASVLGPASDPSLGTGFNWYPGDLLFKVGSDKYGIPLVNHSLFTLVPATPPTAPSVTAFDVYKTNAFQTADDVLAGFPAVTHRTGPTAVVWLGDSPIFLGGPLTHTITYTGDASIGLFKVDITGQLPASFAADVNANGFTVFFASTICANGYLTGSDPPSQLPEPASLVLLATGLLGMGSVVRHRVSGLK